MLHLTVDKVLRSRRMDPIVVKRALPTVHTPPAGASGHLLTVQGIGLSVTSGVCSVLQRRESTERICIFSRT